MKGPILLISAELGWLLRYWRREERMLFSTARMEKGPDPQP